MARTDSGYWVCPKFGHTVARQNMKTEVIENRVLYELLRGGAVAHTAQQFTIAKQSYGRLMTIIDGSDELRSMVKRAPASNQEVLIEFRSGAVVNYKARASNKGLRGMDDVSLVIFDEAQHMTADHEEAIGPITRVNPNPQTWMSGTAHIDGLPPVWWGYRIMAARGDSQALGWFEHSAETLTIDADSEVEQHQPGDLSDRRLWQIANPGFGITIPERNLENDYNTAQGDKSGFARESLNIWDPPTSLVTAKPKIDPHWWRSCADPAGTVHGQVVVAVDTTYDLDSSALVICGRQGDGRRRVELVQHDAGSHWVEIALLDVLDANEVAAITFDASGPAKALRPMLERIVTEHNRKGHTVDLDAMGMGRYQAACASFVADVKASVMTHASDARLTNLAVSIPARLIGETWVWDRRQADVGPLAAATCALAVADSLPEVATAVAAGFMSLDD